MKIRMFASILTFVFTILLIISCATIPIEAYLSNFEQIEVGVTYGQELIAADSENYYRFTPPSSGVYTISVTGVDSDLSWELHDNPKKAWLLEQRSIIAMKDKNGTADEVGQTQVLSAEKEYYLIVFEWDEISGDYELCIRH